MTIYWRNSLRPFRILFKQMYAARDDCEITVKRWLLRFSKLNDTLQLEIFRRLSTKWPRLSIQFQLGLTPAGWVRRDKATPHPPRPLAPGSSFRLLVCEIEIEVSINLYIQNRIRLIMDPFSRWLKTLWRIYVMKYMIILDRCPR